MSKGSVQDKYVLDPAFRQAHAVRKTDFFVPNRPRILTSSPQELADLIPPEPQFETNARAIAVEDNSILPLTPSIEPAPIEMVERIADLAVATVEMKAPFDAESKDGKNNDKLLWYRILAGSFMLLTFGGLGIAAAVWAFNSGPLAGVAG
jgi:hypothetical protein